MTRLVIQRFGGVIPRYLSTVLNENMASEAFNVKLSNGGLLPFRYPQPIQEVAGTRCIKTLFRAKCCWLAFEESCVDVAQWLPSCERVYVTGVEDYPVSSKVSDDCGWDWKRVGLPVPNVFITATYPKDENGVELIPEIQPHISTSRSYLFTYVNSYGEEGSPSLPSNILMVNEGDVVELSLPEHNHEASWDIQSVRIYRTAATFTDGIKPVQEVAENYYFVDEVDISVTSYTDKKLSDELQETLESYQYTPPPKDLKNITALPDGVLVGSVGNQVWFSEPYNPQAWPVDYMLLLDDNVIDLKFAADHLFVLTDGCPYVVQQKVHEETKQRAVRRFEKSAPIISKKSAVSMHHGVIYACNDGLMLVSANNMSLLSKPWYSTDDWQALLPHTLIGAVVQGNYIGFTVKSGFLFNLNDGVENDGIQDNDLMPLTLTPNALFTDRDGTLLMAFGNIIHEWDRGAEFMPYKWRSKIKHLGGLHNMAAAKVMLADYPYPKKTTTPVKVTFISDDRDYLSREVVSSNAFRLPSNRRYMDIDVCVEGTVCVRQIELASSMKELASV